MTPQASATPLEMSTATEKCIHEAMRQAGFNYSEIHLSFPEGSVLRLPIGRVMHLAAFRVKLPNISTADHLAKQIMPLVAENHGALLDIARNLSWHDIHSLCSDGYWASSRNTLAQKLSEADYALC